MEWSVAIEEGYKNGERLVIKHNKVECLLDLASLLCQLSLLEATFTSAVQDRLTKLCFANTEFSVYH